MTVEAAASSSRPTDDVFVGDGEIAALLRELDWSTSPLGPPQRWPQSLRSIVRMMLTSRYQMWMGWGPELAYLYNDAYRPTLGVKHPGSLAKPVATVWKEIWGDIGPLIDQVLATGEAHYREGMLLLLERSGFPEETYHTFSYSPLFGDDGAVAGLFCVVVEETERVLNERRLATIRELASSFSGANTEAGLFEAVQSRLGENLKDLPFTLTYLLDEDGRSARLVSTTGIEPGHPAAPLELNSGASPWPFEALLGTTPAVLVEDLQRIFGALPSGDWDKPPREALLAPIAQQAHERAAAGFLVVGLNPYRVGDQNLRSFIGLVAGQIASGLASVRAYEEERRRAAGLAELDRVKTAFFSNVSHEFRTPLTLMLGPLEELLAKPDADPETYTQIELAHRNGTRLLRLVNSLLDFSRIEAGRVTATFQPTDLAAFSAEIASSFRSAIEKAGLRLILKCEPLPHPVYVDREMWEKVVLNLLSNAFKFTHEGEIEVQVAAGADRRSALLRVRDTGIGIAADELPKLFERFHRIEGAKGRSYEGSGIGLALVQELVKLHAGEISATSVPGEGTTFEVRAPFGAAHLPAEQLRETDPGTAAAARAHEYVDEALRWLPDLRPELEAAGELSRAGLGAIAPAGSQSPGTGRRILLVDDNHDMRAYVRRLLEGQGYVVDAAADGEDALAEARISAPDLVLTDVMMPRLDGFGLLRAIRSDPALAGVPVILLSARAGEEAKVEGLEAGADDYLIKPFAARELLARVHANIQMAEVRREANRAVFRSEQRYLMTHDRLTLALSTGRVAVFEWSVDSDRLVIQGPLVEVFGVASKEAEAGLPLAAFLDAIDPRDRDRVMAILDRSLETGEPYEAEYRVHGAGHERVVISRGTVELDSSGQKRMAGVVIDITEEREAREAQREQSRALEILSAAAAAISGDLDQARVVQTITDASVELTGARFGAFFYNHVDEQGESYTLYTLAGAPREAFSGFPMPRNTEVFGPTFAGEGVVRSEDITKDPRYGRMAPHHGMPNGHLPVRSYLAVPVKSRSGEVLGGLFLGHPECGVFDERAEERAVALASQAAIALDNARLFEASERELRRRREAEAELQSLNASLEERVAQEVAERAKAEDALRQAQKMEAVGQLTGGVAHDFNNLLTVIIGGLDTIKRSKPSDEVRVTRAAEMALQGALRAASLTERLLAFSRRQPLAPKPLQLNALVRDMTELLHRTLGEQIELEGILSPRLWRIEADQNQLESAILNLAVNARDAMPDGGKLTIETANTALDESYSAIDAEVLPGQYVMIAVSDTGTGMSKETLARVFEPFYTTKEVGKGTGLGLSMIYGFAKQSGGHVTIYSEEGQGTTVKLYFPRYLGQSEGAGTSASLKAPTSSEGEVVLVVEDNEDVRAYSTLILGELGYEVLEADDADAALAILKSDRRIDLLFTDVVLPGKSGRVLADAAAELRPGLKVLFTTGYSRNAIVHQGRLDAGVQLISKPFTFEQLATRVRDLLDAPR